MQAHHQAVGAHAGEFLDDDGIVEKVAAPAPILRQLSRSLMPLRFQLSIFGTSSFSTKRRTWARNISCSSLKMSRRMFDLLEIRRNPGTSAPSIQIPRVRCHVCFRL